MTSPPPPPNRPAGLELSVSPQKGIVPPFPQRHGIAPGQQHVHGHLKDGLLRYLRRPPFPRRGVCLVNSVGEGLLFSWGQALQVSAPSSTHFSPAGGFLFWGQPAEPVVGDRVLLGAGDLSGFDCIGLEDGSQCGSVDGLLVFFWKVSLYGTGKESAIVRDVEEFGRVLQLVGFRRAENWSGEVVVAVLMLMLSLPGEIWWK